MAASSSSSWSKITLTVRWTAHRPAARSRRTRADGPEEEEYPKCELTYTQRDDSTFERLMQTTARHIGKDVDQLRLKYRSIILTADDTPSDTSMANGDHIDLYFPGKGVQLPVPTTRKEYEAENVEAAAKLHDQACCFCDHLLEFDIVDKNRMCDTCQALIRVGDYSYFCASCDYDKCPKCFSAEEPEAAANSGAEPDHSSSESSPPLDSDDEDDEDDDDVIEDLKSANDALKSANDAFKSEIDSLKNKLSSARDEYNIQTRLCSNLLDAANERFAAAVAATEQKEAEIKRLRCQDLSLLSETDLDGREQELEERLRRVREEAKERRNCSICQERLKDAIFDCGHLLCCACADRVLQHEDESQRVCPFCQQKPTKRQRLFG